MFDPVYVRQAELLLRCLPEIVKHPGFAMKGSTAINLFIRSTPLLSARQPRIRQLPIFVHRVTGRLWPAGVE